MLDTMQKLREQGYTSAQIAPSVGVSQRTVEAYMRGVTPQLERKRGMERRDLVDWAARVIRKACLRYRLRVSELNDHLVALRRVLNHLDDLTVDQLRLDHWCRVQFLEEFFQSSPLGQRIAEHNKLVRDANDPLWGRFLTSHPGTPQADQAIALRGKELIDLRNLILETEKIG